MGKSAWEQFVETGKQEGDSKESIIRKNCPFLFDIEGLYHTLEDHSCKCPHRGYEACVKCWTEPKFPDSSIKKQTEEPFKFSAGISNKKEE